MGDSPDKLMRMGKLHSLKMRQMELATRGQAKVTAIRNALAVSSVTPFGDLALQDVALLAGEAAELQAEYLQTLEDIKTLQREI